MCAYVRVSKTDGDARSAGIEKRERKRRRWSAARNGDTSERGKLVAAAGDRVPVGPPHL